ncbi:MAG: hypothetical protein ACREEB_18030 [Caulobacteraceae bacterium]
MASFLRQVLAVFRGPAPPEAPPPEPPPQPVENPDLDVERPEEAFEVLRRVAVAVEEDKRIVILKKGRVPPHQRHLAEGLDLSLVAASAEEKPPPPPPAAKGVAPKPAAKAKAHRKPKST